MLPDILCDCTNVDSKETDNEMLEKAVHFIDLLVKSNERHRDRVTELEVQCEILQLLHVHHTEQLQKALTEITQLKESLAIRHQTGQESDESTP